MYLDFLQGQVDNTKCLIVNRGTCGKCADGWLMPESTPPAVEHLMLNEFSNRVLGVLVLDQLRQFDEVEDADDYDPFLGINPYESFGESSQLVPFTIPSHPSPFTFNLQIARSIMGRMKKTTEDRERDNK